MPNEHSDLKAKIDEEALNAGRTDQEVLDWLNELEQGPWVDLNPGDFAAWAAKYSLPGRLFAVRNEVYDAPRADPPGAADKERSAAHMLHQSWTRREGLDLSNTDVRNHLADAVGAGKVVSTAARDEILALARPNVERWRNADWNHPPILGDVVAARALP